MSKRSGLHLLLAQITQSSNNAKVASDNSTDKDSEGEINTPEKEDVYVEHPRDMNVQCDDEESALESESGRQRPVPANTTEELHDTNEMYSPRVCPICMESYTDGDDIAWSYNEACTHVFHRECIVRWLMKNDDCPMCRASYLANTDDSCADTNNNPDVVDDNDADPDSQV